MNEENQIDRIEAYYRRTMPADDRVQFEKELADNSSLHQLYKEHVFFLEGMQGMKLEALEKSLAGTRTTNPHGKISWIRKNRVVVGVAASIMILIGLNWFFGRSLEMKTIAEEYYSLPFAENNRSELNSNTAFSAGMTAFSQQKWEEAINSFGQVDSSQQVYEQSLYFSAHAYAGLDNFEKALSIFNDLSSTNSPLKQQAEWNAILMSMMLNFPRTGIIQRLESIANDRQLFYSAKAKEVLDKLGN